MACGVVFLGLLVSLGVSAVAGHPGAHSHGRMLAQPDGTYICPTCGYVWSPTGNSTFSAWNGPCPYDQTSKLLFKAWSTSDDSMTLCLNSTYHQMGNGGMVMMNSMMSPNPCTSCLGYPCLPDGHGHSHATAAPAVSSSNALNALSTVGACLLVRALQMSF
ncbi:unnamed protein product [Polarella glacialis]|uniref:Uncharacterized protein n=1 Tax=Polarella glacialis TaxID=89957 RepID=A0A813H0G1_POLGL|nr:unnamed protein product [Polarella glacialis]